MRRKCWVWFLIIYKGGVWENRLDLMRRWKGRIQRDRQGGGNISCWFCLKEGWVDRLQGRWMWWEAGKGMMVFVLHFLWKWSTTNTKLCHQKQLFHKPALQDLVWISQVIQASIALCLKETTNENYLCQQNLVMPNFFLWPNLLNTHPKSLALLEWGLHSPTLRPLTWCS